MHQLTILLVDEDQILTSACVRSLFEAGLQGVAVQTAEQALEMARLKAPDAVLVEINIQAGRGWSLCKEIRELPGLGSVPLLITSRTHSHDHQLERPARELKADALLSKPFAPSALLSKLEPLLDFSRVLQPAGAVSENYDPEGVKALLKETLPEIPAPSAMMKAPTALILSRLRREKATGLLYLRENAYKTAFYFRDGIPSYARTTFPPLRITSLLKQAEVITQDQVDHAVGLARSFGGGRWMEEILIGLGYLTQDEMRATVSGQIRDLVKRALFDSRPVSAFFDGDIPAPHGVLASPDIGALVWQGLLAIDNLECLQGHLPPLDSVLQNTGGAAAEAKDPGLGRYEKEFLGLIDGQKTFREVCALGRRTMGNIETLLLGFLDAGLVQMAARCAAGDDEDKLLPTLTGDAEPVNQGDLSDLPVPALLSRLHLARRTGLLSLRRGDEAKTLHLDRGEIVFARSNVFDDRIGRVLVEAQLVEEADVERAADKSGPSKGKRIGGVLMDEGLVTFDQLYWAGQFQVLRIVRSLCDWEAGTYRFEEKDLPSWVAATPPLETANLILEEFRTCPPTVLAKTERLKPDTRLWPSAASQSLDGVQLTDLEEAIVAWVTEPMELSTLLDVGLGETPEVLRAVHGLLAVGLIERTMRGGAAAMPDPGTDLSADDDTLEPRTLH